MIRLDASPLVKATRMVRLWRKRASVLRAWLVFQAARTVHKLVLGALPPKSEYVPYRKSLELVRIGGTGRSEVAVAIRTSAKRRKVKALRPERTVLYIRPPKGRKPSASVAVLERHSPWTLGTLPFYPSRKDAHVVSRLVSEREVQQVAKLREKDRPRWRHALAKAGKTLSRSQRVRIPRRAKAIPDVAFEGLRLELGLGGQRPVPHWRPALRTLKAVVPRWRSDPFVRALFTKMKAPAIDRWKLPLKRGIKASDAAAFNPFVKKVIT